MTSKTAPSAQGRLFRQYINPKRKKGKYKMKFPKLPILTLIIALFGAIGIGVTHISNPEMIVTFGVRTIETWHTIAITITAIAGTATALSLVPYIRKTIKLKQINGKNQQMLDAKIENDKQTFNDYAKDSLNPVLARKRLLNLKEHNCNISEIVDLCIDQMDKMDHYQEKLQTLIDANEAIYLNDTISALNNAELRMCKNYRSIINCMMLFEDNDEQMTDFDKDIIRKAYSSNQEELKTVSQLVRYAVNYINNYEQNGVEDRSELDSWLKVMSQTDKTDDLKFD